MARTMKNWGPRQPIRDLLLTGDYVYTLTGCGIGADVAGADCGEQITFCAIHGQVYSCAVF